MHVKNLSEKFRDLGRTGPSKSRACEVLFLLGLVRVSHFSYIRSSSAMAEIPRDACESAFFKGGGSL